MAQNSDPALAQPPAHSDHPQAHRREPIPQRVRSGGCSIFPQRVLPRQRRYGYVYRRGKSDTPLNRCACFGSFFESRCDESSVPFA
jgi:hypothetical protein